MKKALPKRRGRPSKPYKSPWGEVINGLRHDPKRGRWFAIGGGLEFVEQDERLAVARFRAWQSEQDGVTVELKRTHPNIRIDFGSESSVKPFAKPTAVDDADLWSYVREQLISRPHWVAERVGIAEVARLGDLPKPTPSPKLADLGELFQAKSTVERAYRRRVELAWTDFEKFCKKQDVTTVRLLTADITADYSDDVNGRGFSPKYTGHWFTSIQRVVNFAMERGQNPTDCRHALDCFKTFQRPKATSGADPKPIGRDEYRLLLSIAEDKRMRGALLIMLNLCMYPQESLNLDWSDIDLDKKTVVTDRSKTKVVRIGVLWDETIEALDKIKTPKTGPIFLSREGSRWSVKTLGKQFRDLRASADLPSDTTMDQLRDGAYTAAVGADGVELKHAMLLAGHSSGISDYYVKRNPTMVKDAVAAVYRAYF